MPDMLGVWKRYQVNANRVFLNHLNQMEVWKCHCFRDIEKILGLNFWHYNLAYIVCTYDVGGDISRWFDGWDYVESNSWVGEGRWEISRWAESEDSCPLPKFGYLGLTVKSGVCHDLYTGEQILDRHATVTSTDVIFNVFLGCLILRSCWSFKGSPTPRNTV